jgi:hypothetical protein
LGGCLTSVGCICIVIAEGKECGVLEQPGILSPKKEIILTQKEKRALKKLLERILEEEESST